MRYDLAFLLCCCKSFLGDNLSSSDEDNFYQLLGVNPDATQEEIKRGYKRKSLQMHPDKLVQRGKTVTEEDQARFTRMKDAYECLRDPHKRETYDKIGERGMKWLSDPLSMHPEALAHNFIKSSVLDRSKIFAIFVGLAVSILILPVLVCLHVDGAFGPNASWVATATPLWIWDALVLFYHSQVILMPTMQRPDDMPPEEWVDPLPMKQRIFSLVKFLFLFFFELLLALKLDGFVTLRWAFVFVPLYLGEATNAYKKWPLARLRIVTIEDLERTLGKCFADFTAEEKELIGRRYSVVSSTSGPDFWEAQKLKALAKQSIMLSVFRTLFVVVLVIQLDTSVDFNWWLIFAPFWIVTFLICLEDSLAVAEIRAMANELAGEDEEMGTGSTTSASATCTGNEIGVVAETTDAVIDNESGTTTNYGSVGIDDAATPEAAAGERPKPKLTKEEKTELIEQALTSASQFCTKCCSHGILLILVCLVVAKLQGANFSSLWIISPFLFAAGIILCCLGAAIFGVSEVPIDIDTGAFHIPTNFDDLANHGTNLQTNTAERPSTSPMYKSDNDSTQVSNIVFIGPEDNTELAGLMPTTGGSNGSENVMQIRDLD